MVSIERDGADAARLELERTIAAGGVAAFPSDGLYGLGCDPIDPQAIARIHRIKGRDDGKPSAIMYFSALAMRELIDGLGRVSSEVVATLLPGPFTLVLDNPGRRYPLACGGTPDRLGVRLIDGPLAGARTAIFQTSANRSGEPPVAAFEQLEPGLAAAADLVIDGGRLGGSASTVLDLAELDHGGSWSVLRAGAVSAAEVERRLARIAVDRA